MESLGLLPEEVRPLFDRQFMYDIAEGYVCSCMPGYEGDNCEIDIDECASNPCLHGSCEDGIAQYKCICKPGYEGINCELEINECERYQPCQHGFCTDLINNYQCQCEEGWGGKNCSVALIGCNDVVCLNGGTCTPWLDGEINHMANCTCTAGHDGLRCQSRTTFSLSGKSYIRVGSVRSEGYELQMRFKTTLGNGLVAIGQGNTHFSLQLTNGKLNLHSNLISKFEGIGIGENLNDTQWHKVYVAVNTSHLTLGVDDRYQGTQPINPTGENDTVFYNTFLGGIVRDNQILANNAPAFTGCIQDITVDGMRITEEDFKSSGVRDVDQIETIPGCVRVDQCNPNPCQNSGKCRDLWNSFQCTCHRPFLGPSCQFNYTGGTFGHENITNSIAVVDIEDPQQYASGVDISMFIRTRKEEGFIFYLGSDLAIAGQPKSYITGQLREGNLVVHVSFDEKTAKDKFQVYTLHLSDGYRHFIRVVRMSNSLMVKVNETVSINHEIPSPAAFIAQKLYLGNFPDESVLTTSTTTTTTAFTTTTTTTIEVLTQRFIPSPATTPSPPTSSASPRQLNVETDLPTTIADNIVESNPSPVVDDQVLRRARRDINDIERLGINFIEPNGRSYFKGIIQDVQISDGNNFTRIVEFFQDVYNVIVSKPVTVGEVQLVNVEKGVVSDDTCVTNPCLNGGSCEVTWNDYTCHCTPGYRGRNCAEREYCHWYQCPQGSTCRSLSDGHECISNATFNGVNSTLVLRPQFTDRVRNGSTIQVTFRSNSNGTILHVLRSYDQYIRLSISGNDEAILEVPENDGQMHSYTIQVAHSDGAWHTIKLNFYEDGHVASQVGERGIEVVITLDSLITNLIEFIEESTIAVGATTLLANSPQEAYSFEEDTTEPVIDIRTESGLYDEHFRGCLGELRIADVLVPFFTASELVNNTASDRFDVNIRDDVTASACILCYEQECQNGGVCANPQEFFECQCPDGFEDPLCTTNIDECKFHDCQHGTCQDGINEYTCLCDLGWTGDRCEEDLDECLAEPCLNGGTCTQTAEPGNYTCECMDQFRGHSCEQLKNRTCEDNPCKNDAKCFRKQSNDFTNDFLTIIP